MFDLAIDSYEMKNLAGDPAQRDTQARLSAALDAQIKATGYVVPDGVDKPGDGSEKAAKKKAKAKKQ